MKLNKKVVLLLVFLMFISIFSNSVLAYSYRSGSYYSTSNSRYRYSYSNSYNNYRYSYNNNASNTTDNENINDNNNDTKDESNQEQETIRDESNTSNIVLKYGDRGNEVKSIQNKLDKLGYEVSVTGYYDRRTILAVYYFQKDNGLSRTGRVDSKTSNKLNIVYSNISVGDKDEVVVDPEPAPTPEPTPTPTPEPKPEPAPAPRGSSQMESQMLSLINQERQAHGLQPLVMDSQVLSVARKKSQDMISNNYFSHTSPTYGSPFKMLNDAGVSYRTAGENIAGNSSVSAAHRALMNSSGHKKNILNSNFTKVGIGIVEGGPYGMMFTQIFIG